MDRSEMSYDAKIKILSDLLKDKESTVVDSENELGILKESLPENVTIVDSVSKKDCSGK